MLDWVWKLVLSLFTTSIAITRSTANSCVIGCLPQTERSNRFASPYNPTTLADTTTCLPLTQTTDWSCEAEQAASTSSEVLVGFTSPPASRGLFLKERRSLVVRFIFGGDTTALMVP